MSTNLISNLHIPQLNINILNNTIGLLLDLYLQQIPQMIAEWKIRENQRDLREKYLLGLYFDGSTNLLMRTYGYSIPGIDGNNSQAPRMKILR